MVNKPRTPFSPAAPNRKPVVRGRRYRIFLFVVTSLLPEAWRQQDCSRIWRQNDRFRLTFAMFCVFLSQVLRRRAYEEEFLSCCLTYLQIKAFQSVER